MLLHRPSPDCISRIPISRTPKQTDKFQTRGSTFYESGAKASRSTDTLIAGDFFKGGAHWNPLIFTSSLIVTATIGLKSITAGLRGPTMGPTSPLGIVPPRSVVGANDKHFEWLRNQETLAEGSRKHTKSMMFSSAISSSVTMEIHSPAFRPR